MPTGQSGLCQCCDDHALIAREDCALGSVCADCAEHLSVAAAVMLRVRLLFCAPYADHNEKRRLVPVARRQGGGPRA
jgi:hypothetical protein